MKSKSKAYKKFIQILAYIYVFFKVILKKPRYRKAFTGMFAGVIILIMLIVVLCRCIKPAEKDDSESVTEILRNEYVTVSVSGSTTPPGSDKSGNDSKEEETPEIGETNEEGELEITEEEWDAEVYAVEKDNPDGLWYGIIDVDLNGLKSVNPDIIGWIYFEAADISYPILYSGDNSTYLRTSFDKKNRVAGSIFLEGENSSDFSDKHSLIYGHNMSNKTMFGQLILYKKDASYYSNHQYFQLIYLDSATGQTVKERYRIFACKDVAVDDSIYYIYDENFKNLSDFAGNVIRQGNLLTGTEGIKVNNEDKVITLSTCSDKADRFVVSAVKVAECVLDN